MLYLIAILMFLLVFGACWFFGLWSNLITLINLLIAAMVASSLYENLANLITSSQPRFALIEEFVSVWLIFALTMGLLRALTDSLSSYRLKFDVFTEYSGRTLLSAWIACVFVCFSFFTLQLAPLKPEVFGDREARARTEQGTIPDRAWLAFIQSRSRGALTASPNESLLFEKYQLPRHPDDEGIEARIFDPFSKFLDTSEFRRFAIKSRPTLQLPDPYAEEQ